MIKVEHLYKGFDGTPVLKDISLEYEAGKCNMIIGASGSGKTVLLKNLIGLMKPDSGEISYNGMKLTEMDLNTCWLTFADSEDIKKALNIDSAMEVAAIAAFGYGAKTTKRLRLNMRSMSDVDIVAKHRYVEQKRSVYDMAFMETWGNTHKLDDHIGFFDEMLWESLYAASLSPSYLNRQAYGFVIHPSGISLISRPDEYNVPIDGALSLGIVLHHFTNVAENWAGKLIWRYGKVTADLELPEGYEIVATCAL